MNRLTPLILVFCAVGCLNSEPAGAPKFFGAADHATLPTRFPGQRTTAVPTKRAAPDAAAATWPDRRPIGIIQFADPAYRSPQNPDGWFPVVQSMGFRAYVRQSYDRAVRDGHQGEIFYNVEGSRYDVPVSYVGHPYSGVSAKIPRSEIKWAVEEAGRRGLWVAFTFRQTGYVPGAQLRTISPAATLGSEFNAARAYYGDNVKGIYWDSNIEDRWWEEGGPSEPLNVVWLKRLRDVIGPDVLVMTEFAGGGYADVPNVAPIRFWDGSKLGPTKGSPVEILVPPTTPVTAEQRAAYVDAMRGGAIIWTTSTWDAEDTKWVPDAYRESQAPAISQGK